MRGKPCSSSYHSSLNRVSRCHPIAMHDDGRIGCSQMLTQTLSCGHETTYLCGEKAGRCIVRLPGLRLPCGHLYSPICVETTTGAEFRCQIPLARHRLPCGHFKDIVCSTNLQEITCQEDCGALLPCGHPCAQPCSICHGSNGHAKCHRPCGQSLLCGHHCVKPCHEGVCDPCEQRCTRGCQHGSCEWVCSVICDPCVKRCEKRRCEHQDICNGICSLPCTQLPCSKPCTRPLICGLHICYSLCGEICPSRCLQCDSGMEPSLRHIALDCGHIFPVTDLDETFHLKDLYHVDTSGTILGCGVVKMPSIFGIRCPECWTPVLNTQRYAMANQLGDVPDTVDRLYCKLGRKLSNYCNDISRPEEYLNLTFDVFCNQLKPGPLAGKQNQRLVWDRTSHMLGVQRIITEYRDEVTVPIEEHISCLAVYIDNRTVITAAVSPYKLRFDFLYFRCRLITLEDGLKIYQYLNKFSGFDKHTLIMAEALRFKLLEQSSGEITSLNERINECDKRHLVRLEVEFRIIQLCLHMILSALSTDSGLDISASKKRTSDLCRRFPDTAGKLLKSFQSLRTYLDGGPAPKHLHDLYQSEVRELWRNYGKHIIGSLQHCCHGHPYSSATFSDCPECGREVEIKAQEPQVNVEAVLNKNAFLAHFGIGTS